MIISCPDRATRYHLDPVALTPAGRTVRCASCGHRWQARPPTDAPMLVEAAVQFPAPEAFAPKRPGLPLERQPRRSVAGLVASLAAVVVVVLGAGGILGRDEIVAAFPASAEVYAKLGLPIATGFGLEFEGISSQRFAERGVSILVVEGRIVNVSGRERAVPPVRVTLLDASGRSLQEERFEPSVEVLSAGGEASFLVRVVDPAEQAQNFSVTFDVDTF
jgi:predicted Zn finger-like uncharacterized protein